MRIKNIILTDLLNERLIAYEELERALNKKDNIASIVGSSKTYLKKIVELKAMIDELQSLNSQNLDETLKSFENKNTENE